MNADSDDGDEDAMSGAQDESEDENGLERRLSGPHPRVTKILLVLPDGTHLGVPAGLYTRPPAAAATDERNDEINEEVAVHDDEQQKQTSSGVVSSELFDRLVERVTVHPSTAAPAAPGRRTTTTRRRRGGGGKKKKML